MGNAIAFLSGCCLVFFAIYPDLNTKITMAQKDLSYCQQTLTTANNRIEGMLMNK